MVAVPYHDVEENGYAPEKHTLGTGAAATKGYFAYFDATAESVDNNPTDGNQIVGIFKETAAAGEDVLVYTSGIFTISMATGVTMKAGEDVYPTNDGELLAGAAGLFSCGHAVTAFASGGSGRFRLRPSWPPMVVHA